MSELAVRVLRTIRWHVANPMVMPGNQCGLRFHLANALFPHRLVRPVRASAGPAHLSLDDYLRPLRCSDCSPQPRCHQEAPDRRKRVSEDTSVDCMTHLPAGIPRFSTPM